MVDVGCDVKSCRTALIAHLVSILVVVDVGCDAMPGALAYAFMKTVSILVVVDVGCDAVAGALAYAFMKKVSILVVVDVGCDGRQFTYSQSKYQWFQSLLWWM